MRTINKIFQDGYILTINKRDLSDVVTNDLHSKDMIEPRYSLEIDDMEILEDSLELRVSVYSEVFH